MKKGFITIQFLFALAIVMFFVQAFLGLCYTLFHGTLVQYITYSSARKLSLGSMSYSIQVELSKEKYEELREKIYKTNNQLTGRDWVGLPLRLSAGNLGFNNDYESSPQFQRNLFYGVSVPFISRIFNFHIPFLTQEDKRDLKTSLGSYLGREPAMEECERFFQLVKRRICREYRISPCIGEEAEAANGC